MTKNSLTYSLGDKVVHRSYGVGEIDGIERKPIKGIEVECFKVKTENGHYWFPTEGLDNHRIHPIASQELIEMAINKIRSAPQGLENDHLQWKERIDNVQSDGDLLAISELVRDLAALKTTKNLSQVQSQALKTLEDRLLREWAASSGVDVSTIQPKFRAYLKESKTLIQQEDKTRKMQRSR
jgi:RNA polymerase-interacting CarD/CdnL/TRCF family regulator